MRGKLKYIAVTCVAACALSGAVASAALAQETTVEPAGEQFSVVNTTNLVFTTNSGTGEELVCERSEAEGEVPPAPGNNNPNGPVGAEISPPTFEENCEAVGLGLPAVVTTNENQGSWMFNVEAALAEPFPASITVPQEGAVISIAGGLCIITIGTLGEQDVEADYFNGPPAPTVAVNGNVQFGTAGFCPGINAAEPAIFEGEYEIISANEIEVF